MKSIKILIYIFSLSILLTSCGQKGDSISVTTEIYCDHCETCESCKARVENALKATDGITSADMKVSEKKIVVDFDGSKIKPEQIKQVIALTGFDAGDIKPDPAAYDNLDDCCKKK